MSNENGFGKIDRVHLEEVMDHLFCGLYIVKPDREIIGWNKAAENITGYTAEEMVGKHCPETNLHHTSLSGEQLCRGYCPLLKTFSDGQVHEDTVLVQKKSGKRTPIKVRFIPLFKDGKVVEVAECFEDIPGGMNLADDVITTLSYKAGHDFLTKLPNRMLMKNQILSFLYDYETVREPFCLVYFDIDDFKSINDVFGHAAGDAVLTEVGKTTLKRMKPNSLIARYGGEEFVAVSRINTFDEAFGFCNTLKDVINNLRVTYNGDYLKITASFGLTLVRDGDTAESLVARGDHLMYEAKKEGKNRIVSDIPV